MAVIVKSNIKALACLDNCYIKYLMKFTYPLPEKSQNNFVSHKKSRNQAKEAISWY